MNNAGNIMWEPFWKHKKLVVRPELCIGCRSCELICAYKHANAVSLASAAVKVYELDRSVATVPLVCMHCDQPECVKACNIGALRKDDMTGVVSINSSLCVLCQACVHACPYGNIKFEETHRIMVKCDQCGGDPACVNVCPVGAIDIVDSKDFQVKQDAIVPYTAAVSGKGGI